MVEDTEKELSYIPMGEYSGANGKMTGTLTYPDGREIEREFKNKSLNLKTTTYK